MIAGAVVSAATPCRKVRRDTDMARASRAMILLPSRLPLRGDHAIGNDADARDAGAMRRIDHWNDVPITQRSIAANPECTVLPIREDVAQAHLQRDYLHRLMIDRQLPVSGVLDHDVRRWCLRRRMRLRR